MKDLIAADLDWSGFTVATEVLGLFKSALPSALQGDGEWGAPAGSSL